MLQTRLNIGLFTVPTVKTLVTSLLVIFLAIMVVQAQVTDRPVFLSSDEMELCDGVDNNHDGRVDEDSAMNVHMWYADADRDSLGDPNRVAYACTRPNGYVGNAEDPDDRDERNPITQQFNDFVYWHMMLSYPVLRMAPPCTHVLPP